MLTLEELSKTKDEVDILQQSVLRQETIQTLLEEKGNRILQLEAQISEMQQQLSTSPIENMANSIQDAAIVHFFHSLSQSHLVKKGDASQLIPARAASDDEWKKLEVAVRLYHPRFYLFIKDNHRLSRLEFKVCILSRLHFEKMEMATLLGVRKQSVTNARASLAKKLFNLGSAYDLDANLLGI